MLLILNIDFHILRATDEIDKKIRGSLMIALHVLEVACHKSSTGGR